jgi:serine/threonine protein phosphatase PrpC
VFRPYFPKPDVLVLDRDPRDKFLIIATGGLWENVTPAEACNFIHKRLRTSRITMTWEMALDDKGSPTILAKELAELARRNGTKGNVTVVVILFKNFWDKNLP